MMARTTMASKRTSKSIRKNCRIVSTPKKRSVSRHVGTIVSKSSGGVLRTPKHYSTTAYTGTPDSDVVARHLERFEYNPNKKQKVLKKYEYLK